MPDTTFKPVEYYHKGYVLCFKQFNTNKDLFLAEFYDCKDDFTIYLVSNNTNKPSEAKFRHILALYYASKLKGKEYHFEYDTLKNLGIYFK